MSMALSRPTTLDTLVARPAEATGEADDILALRRAEEHAASGGSSFGDVFFETYVGGPTGALFRKAGGLGFARDPNFVLTQTLLDDFTRGEQGIDFDLWDNYADAVSEAHAQYIHENNMIVMNRRRVLAESKGFGSFSAQILGSLADPGSIAVGILTGGAGFTAKVGMIGNAAIAGGSNMALTGVQASEDPSITGMDILRAGAGGAGFGAASVWSHGMNFGGRVAAGAAGQAFPPGIIDLFDDRPGNAKLLEFGTNLAFGGLFNALPSTRATDAQVAMGETSHRVGTRMADEAMGKPVDYASSKPAIEALLGIDPNASAPTKTLGAATAIDPKQPGFLDSVITDAQARKAERAKALFEARTNAPSGSRMGTSILPDIVDDAVIVAAKAIKAGVRGVEAIKAIVVEYLGADNEEVTRHAAMLVEAGERDGKHSPEAFNAAMSTFIERANATVATRNSPRIPNNPLSLNLAEIVRDGDPNQVPFTGMSTPFNLGGIDGNLSQWSKTAMAGSSEVPEIRLIAQLIGFDPTLKADGSKALYATNEWLRDTNNRIMHPFFQGLDAAYHAHTVANPGKAMTEPDFRVAVGKALARDLDTISDPHVKQAAAHIRKTVYDGLIELAPDHGVDVGKVNNYVNRVHIAEARDNFAFEVGAKLRPNGSKGEQRLLGRQVLETMFTNAGIKAGVDPEQAARNAFGIIEKAGVGSLVEDSTGASIGSGKNRTMERIELDETHRETITFPDGTTREFGVEDFLERDVLNLASVYTHQMTHLFAISRIGELMGVNMDGSVTRLEGVNAILKHVEEAAKLRGLRPEQYANDLNRAKSLLKFAAGIPEHDTTTATRTLDTLRNLAIFKTMGNVGSAINNVVELLGDATATLGFWNVVTQIWPSIKDVYTLARKRQLSPETARELADLGAIMERYITRYMPRIGESIDNPIGRTAVELGATRLARLSMDASLQSFGQDVSVLATARAMVRKWEQIAASGQGFSEKRLGLMTLDKADEARIIEQIKAHSVGGDGKPLYENGVRRKGVEFGDLNEQAWDVDTRQTFFQARQHTNRTLIQQGNPTALAQWMTTPTGKVLAQLRGFSFGAHANKFLSELQVRDEITAKKVLYGTTAAGLAYIGRTYMDAAFQKDKEAFLERRLSTKNIALAAYSRASYAALFPTAFDGVYADILRNEGVFSQFRPSGTKGGALLGTPLVQTALDIGLPGDPARVFRAMYHAVTPARDFSRQDYDALKSGSMLPDILNLRKLADQYAKDLPAESQ